MLSFYQKLIISVDTDGRCSLEENMRQTLLACFREYVNILTQMAFTHVRYYLCSIMYVLVYVGR